MNKLHVYQNLIKMGCGQGSLKSTSVAGLPSRVNRRVVHVRDMPISGHHRNTPRITGGVVMSANKLVLADYNNWTITMLGLPDSTAQIQLSLSSRPWDITLVNSAQLAVTCPLDHKLIFVNVGGMLQLDREVKVKGHCYGIACINDRLVVSYDGPVKVELLSFSGEMLKTVVTADHGKQLFSCPFYVEVGRDLTNIYIADWGRNTVTRLSLAGKVLGTYNGGNDNNMLAFPHGLTIDKTGSVYVCGSFSNNVVQLAADLTQPRQLLQASDGIKLPESVCYCQATDTLVIGMENSAVIKVVQLQ